MNTGWWEIDIHGCYSQVKIAFAPICACKNNRCIWRHNASASRSPDVTDQLWWHHNVKSEKTAPSDNGEMSDRRFFWSLVRWFANDFHSWLRHLWKSLANHPTRDQKIIIHGKPCIILYIIIQRLIFENDLVLMFNNFIYLKFDRYQGMHSFI